jgi:hypothetical protein
VAFGRGVMDMRPEVLELAKLGPFPSDKEADVATVNRFQVLVESIQKPVTNEEARALIKLFGPDDFFELVWPLIHLIETAPGWSLEDCLMDTNNEWIERLKRRVENAERRRKI